MSDKLRELYKYLQKRLELTESDNQYFTALEELYLNAVDTPKHETVEEWIKIGDRLPQEMTVVWIYIDSNIVRSYYNGVCWTMGNSILKDDLITHWMEYKAPKAPIK